MRDIEQEKAALKRLESVSMPCAELFGFVVGRMRAADCSEDDIRVALEFCFQALRSADGSPEAERFEKSFVEALSAHHPHGARQ